MPNYRVIATRLAVFIAMALLVPTVVQAQAINKQGKNWRLQLKTQFVYDDNVAQNPDVPLGLTTQGSDAGWKGNAAFTYKHKFNNNWSIAADYDIDATLYGELTQYNLLAQMWGVKPKYKLNENAFFDMQYFYIWNVAGGNSFSGVNYINPSFNYLHKKFGLTRVHYFYKNTDNFINQGRDGSQHGGGITQIYLIPHRKHYVGVGYQVSSEDTVGRFDRTIHDFKVLGAVQLLWGVELKGEYKFSLRNYDIFAATNPSATREDNQHNFRFRFRKVLWEKLGIMEKVTARLDFHHQNNRSNLTFRDYKSNRVMGGFEARF